MPGKRTSRLIIPTITIADALFTFLFVFAAQALPFGHTGPAAPVSYWLAKPSIYMLIAPIAAGVARRRGNPGNKKGRAPGGLGGGVGGAPLKSAVWNKPTHAHTVYRTV